MSAVLTASRTAPRPTSSPAPSSSEEDDEAPLAPRRPLPRKRRVGPASTSPPAASSRLKRPRATAPATATATSTATASATTTGTTTTAAAAAATVAARPAKRTRDAVVRSNRAAAPDARHIKTESSLAKAAKLKVKAVKKVKVIKNEPEEDAGGEAAAGADAGMGVEARDDAKGDGYRWWDDGEGEEKNKLKWTTLEHNAVIFPPAYEPHGVPMLYDGEEIALGPEAEEVASFYAAKLGSDNVKKATFRRNFFDDFKDVLRRGGGQGARVKHLEKCDFSRIAEHLETKRREKKDAPAAERKRLREEEVEKCRKYTVALVDGREEKVGNYKVEPPGLFLGRGEHPKMGKVKARIYPEDITINIGRDARVPPCPLEGHNWGKIIHKQDVTWLCFWKDSITGGSKYVWLAAGSAFKGMSDHAKFEKARRLRNHIEKIRHDYKDGWRAKSKEVRQRSVAMYLIDKLALRVGNEKGDEEADTVGCCSLRVEHVKFVPPHTIELDFLGKDSIRYFNSVEVKPAVYENLKLFCRNKDGGDEIFHRLTVTGLNDYLKSLMDGLSAKVFRTYNASHTLDRLLQGTPAHHDPNEKNVFYQQQNKEVAILCNHQRALPKAHSSQMEKMDRKVSETQEWLAELKRGRNRLKKSKEDSIEVIQWMPEKPTFTDDMDDKARAAERKRAADAARIKTPRQKKMPQLEAEIGRVTERLAKLRADMQVKDDLKTVALGTSKINYLDPRITVAWCKKHEVPIERIFAKTLLVKFAWAMETPEDFRF